MRTPDPKASAYVVRSRKRKAFRRCGIVFGLEPMTIAAERLTDIQKHYLLNAHDNHLIVEEIVAAAPAAPPMPAASLKLPATPEAKAEVPPAPKPSVDMFGDDTMDLAPLDEGETRPRGKRKK